MDIKKPYTWGFPVADPEKMFNTDGTLGEAGELLKKSFTKIFKEYDQLRIDHFIGLVDPWVYPEDKNAASKNGAGRLYSSPHIKALAKYSIITKDNFDKDKLQEYTKKGEVWSELDFVKTESLTDEQLQNTVYT